VRQSIRTAASDRWRPARESVVPPCFEACLVVEKAQSGQSSAACATGCSTQCTSGIAPQDDGPGGHQAAPQAMHADVGDGAPHPWQGAIAACSAAALATAPRQAPHCVTMTPARPATGEVVKIQVFTSEVRDL